MRTGTVVSLGASAMLGVGALVVAKLWLPQGGNPQSKATAAAVATVPVVVASTDIAYGAKLDAARLTVEHLPVGAAPRGAFSDPRQILSQAGGPPIALTPMVAHEPVLADKLSGGGARPTVAAIIDAGMRAYTIGVSDVAGGGGHVMPGDRVDVVLTCNLTDLSGAGQGKRLVSGLVLQDVRVLGMDLNADPTSTQAAVAHTATLEVSPHDAETLALAAQAGTLSLALRRTGSASIAPVKPMAVFDLASIGVRVGAGPAHAGGAPHPAARPAPRAPGRTHSILVVHGDVSSTVQVPSEGYGVGA
ncbi:MAG TPA: Flp pilus assembly protein CpaB [Caulobacteraceae bacterium]|nr:Flp pilus assembly protein CpaB [Caulobacteraceae bacterium]